MDVKDLVGRGYAKLFAHERMQPVNHALYHLALRGMGYNNGWQPALSGEEWFVREVLAPAGPRTCFDVGANVGVYSELLLQHTRADVVAFEPLPAAAAQLRRIKAGSPDHDRRLTILNTAVGSVAGTEQLRYGDPTTEHASLSDGATRIDYVAAGNTEVMDVEVVTLDGLLETSPWDRLADSGALDFVKIDVEGYEYEVLTGAQRMIATCRPRFVQIEWNLHQLTTNTSFLSTCELLPGYTPYQLLPHGMRRVDPMTPDANTFCYANFVFVDERQS